jgi:ATP-dependent RNA helicase HelY
MVPISPELAEVSTGVSEANEVITAVELNQIMARLNDLELPDLNELAAAHRARERSRIDDTMREMAAEIAEARDQAKVLQVERLEHPCHKCERRNEHREYLTQVDLLDKERRGVEELLSREIEAEADRIRGVIRGIRNVLHTFGYLHRGYPTAKADMLAAVFDNDGLILCELVDRGILDNLPAPDLAEVFSWFSFDRDFRNSNRFVLPDRLVLARRRIEDVEHGILGEERAEGLDVSEGHNPSFYGAARAWCGGATMAEISDTIDLSEGDLVLTFNKTIDLMRQVREMLVDTNPDHPLATTLVEATRLMKRDIVEQSLMLGFLPITLPEPIPDLTLEPEARVQRPRARTSTRSRTRKDPASAVEAPPADTAPKKRARKKSEDIAPAAAPKKRTRKKAGETAEAAAKPAKPRKPRPTKSADSGG